ncbi:MAG: DUF4185 domain-containing protein [Myxococcales bacterium]|nr:DUF4185 domain-containing protein [Myxococcales bacterium]
MRRLAAVLALSLLSCRAPPSFRVTNAAEDGLVPRTAWIQGRDGGPSSLAFGRTVWTYGDTVLNDPDEDGTSWHTNSYGHADPARWREGFVEPVDSVGAPRFFIELTAEEKAWNALHGPEECDEPPCGVMWALWPSAPMMDPAGDRAWILYGLFNSEHPSGIGVASWAGLDQPVVRHRIGDSWLLFPEPQPEWANAPVIFDGSLYAFACPREGLARPCSIGRAPLDAVDEPSAWRFFDGDAWSPDMDDADELFHGAPIMEVTWIEPLHSWLLAYSDPFDNDVVARTAPALEGPWSREEVLFTVDGDAPYDIAIHGELAEDDGLTQFITFSRPTDQGWFGAEHVIWRVTFQPAS